MAFLIFSVKTTVSIIKVSFKHEPVKLVQNVKDHFFKAVLSIKGTIFFCNHRMCQVGRDNRGVSWSKLPAP